LSRIVVATLRPERVAHAAFDGVGLRQVTDQTLFAVLVLGMAASNDRKAVAKNELINGSRKYRRRYVDEDGLAV